MNSKFNLRKEVQSIIHRAIDSSINYSGEEYEQNKHNWIQISTDRAIAAVMESLPDAIDIRSKYETEGGIYVNVSNENSDEENQRQMAYLANYQEDQGWNHYYLEYTSYLRGLYSSPQNMVQSEHDTDNRISGTSEGDSPSDKEPSKVR